MENGIHAPDESIPEVAKPELFVLYWTENHRDRERRFIGVFTSKARAELAQEEDRKRWLRSAPNWDSLGHYSTRQFVQNEADFNGW